MAKLRKREKFVTISVLLCIFLWFVQYIPLGFWRYFGIVCFSLLTYILSAISLSDDLQITEWFTILPFHSLYSLAIGLFYFLLPTNLFSRLVIIVIFGVGTYFLFLMSNVYSISKGRTIQLINAAHSNQIFFSMLISLLLINTLFSFQLIFYQNCIIIFLIHFWLSFFNLWAQELDLKIKFHLWQLSFLSSLLVGQLGIILDFIPFPIWHKALFIMAFFYIILSLFQQFLNQKLFKKTFAEYYLVMAFMLVLLIFLFPRK